MVRIEENKSQTKHKGIEVMLLPSKAYIPLSQHVGKVCNPEVKIDDYVVTGQMIASAKDQVYAAIHASISGKVISIGDWPHPLLGECKAIAIESDGLDRLQLRRQRSESEVDKLTPQELRSIVFEAGIVGMGGAGFPTHIKINPTKPVDVLIINGAECEPYLTGDSRLMIEKTREIIQGVELVIRCTGAKVTCIAIEENKPEAVEKFNLAKGRIKLKLKVLKSEYPQGAEKQLIKSILGKEVPSGKLPFDVGAAVQNVATVYAIYEAVYLGKPLYERVVTVTGDCLENPGNLLARIGTPIRELIAKCGPLKKEPKKVIFGGPMMGIAQYSLDTPVIKTTTGIILLSESQIKEAEESFCIRCGRCVEYCPLGLMPCLIRLASQKEKWDLASAYGCLECMECGLCNYVCPQTVNILQSIKQAKIKILKK